MRTPSTRSWLVNAPVFAALVLQGCAAGGRPGAQNAGGALLGRDGKGTTSVASTPLASPTSGGLPGLRAAMWTRRTTADRLFESTSGWIGADGAYTIDLGNDRVLWLFGDTLQGRVQDGRRAIDAMVHNTVAIQQGRDPETARISFSMGRGVQGVFATPDGQGWIWPLHGVRTTARLNVFLTQAVATGEAGPFGFRTCGNALAQVANPDEPPDRWTIVTRPIPHASFAPQRTRMFGSAIASDPETIYIWGFRDQPAGAGVERSCILARAPWTAPERFEEWRFWDGTGWSPSPDACAAVFDRAVTELSVHEQDGRWIALSSGEGLTADIVARTAPAPQGPWSAPQVVFRCPEAAPGVLTYAAKAHPELAHAPGEIAATYATNTFSLGAMATRNDLYRPRFIRGTVQSLGR